ncbi:hypothetical protein FXO38_31334 [Capsicum annuum]|nr:hypothetical protein FXO38_31334 [Capsicum annuum]KAF3640545.1 hypothetical protein FXO37_23408 [Capsicum annuum]
MRHYRAKSLESDNRKLHDGTMQSYRVTTFSMTWKFGTMCHYCGATLKIDNFHLSYLRDAMKAQLVASQFERGVPITLFFEAIRIGQFMRLHPPMFTGTKVEEDPRDFIDEMEKILCIMHAS